MFLKAYKDLENALREIKGISVKEYEDSLSNTEEQEKLRLARIVRNYYSHNNDGEKLIKVNKDLIDFISVITTRIQNEQLKVKDIYKSVSKSKHIMVMDNLMNMLDAMSSKNIDRLCVVSKDNIFLGELDYKDLTKALLKEVNNKTTLAKLNKILPDNLLKKKQMIHISKTTDVSTLQSGLYIVVETNKDGTIKVLGECIV